MQNFTTPAPIATVLDIPAGRLRLVASDRTDTVVEVLPADAGKSRDVKAAEQVQVGFADGVLRIEMPAAKYAVIGHSGAVEVTVQLPTGSRIDAKAAAADLRSAGRLGDVAFDAAQGQVQLDQVASARLTLQSGGVTIGHLNGSAEISTQQGDIRIAEALRGTLVLRTTAGDVSVGAASGVSAALDAGTGQGRITNALQNTGAAELTVRATTGRGDITARSL
jgi:DUF4097 and DUF4098 domain-containing protein YvlB